MASPRGRDFRHPYTPYDIQISLMNAVYECLENGKVGIFESPTGTGKSLGLICGSLTWLRDHRRHQIDQETQVEQTEPDEPLWLLEHARDQKKRAIVQRQQDENIRLAQVRAKEDRARARFESGELPTKKLRTAQDDPPSDVNDEASFLVAEYESDQEFVPPKGSTAVNQSGLSAGTQALIDQLSGTNTSNVTQDDLEEAPDETKIFFCSRTHSQLTQFVNELRRVKPAPVIEPLLGPQPPTDPDASNNPTEVIKHAALGSRKSLCINPKVSRLHSISAINEKCLELQQDSASQGNRCKFLPNKDNQVLVNDFRDHALARVRDIEDFAGLGKKIGICPYYASRAVVRPSEIVTLPYPLLFQKSAREAMGISLKNHVVIIDEAHNLMDAINGIHSVTVTLAQLQKARDQLGVYLRKFRNKLAGKNRVYITQLARLIDSLMSFLSSKQATMKTSPDGLAAISDLMTGKGLDQVNLFKLMRYLQESKLARKVDRYTDAATAVEATDSKVAKPNKSAIPALTHVQSFLLALTHPGPEGRFFYSSTEPKGGTDNSMQLRYVLLDPTFHFRDIVDEARAVVLAGGTMSPMSDYTRYLLDYLPEERLQTLSCGHVIPPSNLLALPVSKGPNGLEFEFTFERRNSDALIKELGLVILTIAEATPDGLVIFFPSHAYLNSVKEIWEKCEIWKKLYARKRVFVEPISTATAESHHQGRVNAPLDSNSSKGSPVEEVLKAYAARVHEPGSGGAVLLAVIGGSLSEGINFADRLGRAVAVVGLPFPNAQSPEWKAKLEYVQQRASSAAAAKEFYTNACMRAVNQTIGRVIRHKGDYAAILLIDRRYGRADIRDKLPGWIKDSLVANSTSFQDVKQRLLNFFEGKA